MIMNRRGLSPVIATVLLIAIVIVLAVIIFLWAKGFISEKAEKFDRAVEFSCEDVNFESDVVKIGNDYYLDVINRGNVPIYGFVVKTLGLGSVEITSELLGNTITIGQSDSILLGDAGSINLQTGQELLIVPIILGKTNAGKVAYTCQDNYGFPAVV